MELMKRTPAGYFKAHNATITGRTSIGPDTSVWFNAVIRGDIAPVTIGRRVSIQDGVVIHVDTNEPNVIGNDIIIGHGAIVHGLEVGDNTLIGMGATILNRTRIGRGCIIAAGCVVPPGMVVPDGSLVMGVPAKVARPVTDKDLKYIASLVESYVKLGWQHVNGEIASVD